MDKKHKAWLKNLKKAHTSEIHKKHSRLMKRRWRKKRNFLLRAVRRGHRNLSSEVILTRKKTLQRNSRKLWDTDKGFNERQGLRVSQRAKISHAQRTLLRRICRAGIRGFVLEHPFQRYSIDIANPKKKIAIEVDGWFPRNSERDKRKERLLRRNGWKVVRIPDGKVREVLLEDLLR